jgi:hypothetical protein
MGGRDDRGEFPILSEKKKFNIAAVYAMMKKEAEKDRLDIENRLRRKIERENIARAASKIGSFFLKFGRMSKSATDLPSEEENDLQKFLKTEARIIVDEMQSEWGRRFAKAEVEVTNLINRKQKDEQKKELLRQMTQINAWANKVFLKPIEDKIASIKASIPRSRVIADDYRDRN